MSTCCGLRDGSGTSRSSTAAGPSNRTTCTARMPVTVPGDTTPLITLPRDPRSAAGPGSRQGAPVQLVFGPDDLEAYAVVRDRLRLHIVAWARRRGLTVEPSLVAAALDHKHSVDGRLGHWTRAHVADALAVWFPRTVALLPDDRDAVPAALHALIGFLAERDWLDSRSDPSEELHTQVADSTPALHDALDDERNHDLGTFWAVQMLRHGVPTADPTAVARFIERVHAGELDIDRAALRDITRRERRADPQAPSRPLPAGAAARGGGHARRRRLVGRARPAARLHPLGARGPFADPRRQAAARRRPRRRRGARPRPLRPRPRPRRRRAPRDHAALQLGTPGPVRPGRARTAGAGQERRAAAVAADRDVEARVRGHRRHRRALRRDERVRRPVVVRDEPRRGLPDAAQPALRRGRRPDPGRAVPPAACARPSTPGWAASSTTSRATSSSGCGAATSPRCSTRWSCSAPCTSRRATPTTTSPTGSSSRWRAATTRIRRWSGSPRSGCGRCARCSWSPACTRRSWASSPTEDIEYVCVRCVGMRREVAEAELAAWVAARPGRAAAHEVLHYLQRVEDPAHRDLALHALRPDRRGTGQPRGPAAAADRAPAPRGPSSPWSAAPAVIISDEVVVAGCNTSGVVADITQ